MSLFSERLKKLRGDMSQTEAAAKIGITAQTLGRYENEQRKPDSEVILMLCKHYGVSADYLLGLSDVKSVNSDIQTACKVTGLSEKAISKLNSIKDDPLDGVWSPAITEFIESDAFSSLMLSIWYLREASLIARHTKEIMDQLNEIINNDDFSLEIRENFFQRYANCFGYSAESIYQDAEYRRRTGLSWTGLSLPENYVLLRTPGNFISHTQQEIELHEYRSTKQLQKILQEIFAVSEQSYPSHKNLYNELTKRLYRYDVPEEQDETAEEQRFGEYIRNLFEKEAENNGKHNLPKE